MPSPAFRPDSWNKKPEAVLRGPEPKPFNTSPIRLPRSEVIALTWVFNNNGVVNTLLGVTSGLMTSPDDPERVKVPLAINTQFGGPKSKKSKLRFSVLLLNVPINDPCCGTSDWISSKPETFPASSTMPLTIWNVPELSPVKVPLPVKSPAD